MACVDGTRVYPERECVCVDRTIRYPAESGACVFFRVDTLILQAFPYAGATFYSCKATENLYRRLWDNDPTLDGKLE